MASEKKATAFAQFAHGHGWTDIRSGRITLRDYKDKSRSLYGWSVIARHPGTGDTVSLTWLGAALGPIMGWHGTANALEPIPRLAVAERIVTGDAP